LDWAIKFSAEQTAFAGAQRQSRACPAYRTGRVLVVGRAKCLRPRTAAAGMATPLQLGTASLGVRRKHPD
jgi:hypothetical protein